MRYLLGALLLISTLFAPIAGAQVNLCPGQNAQLKPMVGGMQTITVSSTALGLTIPQGAELAVGTVEAADIRYRDDGTAPTASVGVLLSELSVFAVCQGALARVQFIRVGTDATLTVTYYGR